MLYVVAFFVLAAVTPHLIGWWRGINVGRSAIRSHRQSVKMGVRMGRWQIIAAFTFGVLIASKFT